MENNITDINTPVIDPEEFSAMETEAEKVKDEAEAAGGNIGLYTHRFKTPLLYDGKTYTELHFDFDSLTGRDISNIDDELERKGVNVTAREFNSKFHELYAAKACTEKIGSDIFMLMKAAAYIKITRQVKTFLLLAG